MDSIDYKIKYAKYVKKHKRLLEQLEKYENVDEQEVRYIGIEISNISTDEEDNMMHEIIGEKYERKFNILKTLLYIKDGYLKYKSIKNRNNLHKIAELKHEQLNSELDKLLQIIRGENTLLSFDLSYVNMRTDYYKGKKRIYILELLPPDKQNEQTFQYYGTQPNDELSWNIDDHSNENTLKYKWLSGNHSWKWDSDKNVWITNNIRPWYFTNFHSSIYIKSLTEWDKTLTEVLKQEKNRQNYLNLETLKEEKMKKKNEAKNNSLFGNFTKFFSKKGKVHITDDDDDDKNTDEITL